MAISDIRKRTEAEPKTLWKTCATCTLLASLPDEEAADLRALLADEKVRYKWLAKQLQDDGHNIDWQPLSRHARASCAAREKLRGAK